MGTIQVYKCKDCGFRFEHRDGMGFYLFRVNRSAKEHILSGEYGEFWKEKLLNNPNAKIEFSKSVYFCENCNEYHTIPTLKLYIPNEGYIYDEYEKARGERIDSDDIIEIFAQKINAKFHFFCLFFVVNHFFLHLEI